MANERVVYKEKFAVIGKTASGSVKGAYGWIKPLWAEVNGNFKHMENTILKSENGEPIGMWGTMSDNEVENKGLQSSYKYFAGYEADIDIDAPEGFDKWIIPEQTYIVVSATFLTYFEVFSKYMELLDGRIVGTVHEYYPNPSSPSEFEFYFPISSGKKLDFTI